MSRTRYHAEAITADGGRVEGEFTPLESEDAMSGAMEFLARKHGVPLEDVGLPDLSPVEGSDA